MLNERRDRIAIWAGDLVGSTGTAYFAERYGGPEPISRFARDLGVKFYDHDWLEVLREPDESESTVREILSTTWCGEAMVARLKELADTRCRCVVAFAYHEYEGEFVARHARPGKLVHLANIETPEEMAR